MAPARATLKELKNKRTGKENSDGRGPGHLKQIQHERKGGRRIPARAICGPGHLKQTEKKRKDTRRIRMAPARAILDKLKTHEKAEGEFGWLRPGPS